MVLSRRRKATLALASLAAISLLGLYPIGRNYLGRARELGRLKELGVAASRFEFEAKAPAEGANSAEDFKAAIAALDESGLSESDLLVLVAYGESGGDVDAVQVGKDTIEAEPRVRKNVDRLDPALALLARGANKSRCSFAASSNFLDPQSGWAKPALQIVNLLGARLAHRISRGNKDGAIRDFQLLADLSRQIETSSLGFLQVESLGRCGMRLASTWREEEAVVELVVKALEESVGNGPAGTSMQPGVYESRELLWSTDPSVALLSQPDTFGWAYRSKLNRLMAEEKILAYWRKVSESSQADNPAIASPSFLAELDQDKSFSGELASQVVHSVLERKRPVSSRSLRNFYAATVRQKMWPSGDGHMTSHAESFARAPLTP